MSKTLVCILSETRGHEITWPSFKKHVLEELDADLLLCIGCTEKYDFTNPFWQIAKWKKVVKEFDDWGQAFDVAKRVESQASTNLNSSHVDWRILLNVGDQWLGGIKGDNSHPGSAGILIAMRWFLFKYICSENLLDRYDRFVVTRSDFVWSSPHPSVDFLDSESIWVPDGEGYGGWTDRHAVLSRNNLSCYLGIIRDIILSPQKLKDEMLATNELYNLERFIKLCLKKAGLTVKTFPYAMYSVRHWGGSTRWAKGTWSDELGYYIKYPTEYRAASKLSKIVKSQDDWVNVFSSKIANREFNCYLLSECGSRIALVSSGLVVVRTGGPAPSSYCCIDLLDGYVDVFISSDVEGSGSTERNFIASFKFVRRERDVFSLQDEASGRFLHSIGEKIGFSDNDGVPARFKMMKRYG